MKTAIEVYKDVIEEFEVDDSQNVSPVGRISYVQEQIGQQKAIINRLLFDITVAKVHQAEAKDKTTEDAHRKKVDDFRNDLRQLLSAVKINLQLVDQLREEYPELQVGQ